MTGERRPDQLAQWIRANRPAYTRDALEQTARQQGWSPEEIAAAWAIVDAGQPTSEWTRAQRLRTGLTEGRAELVLLGLLLLATTTIAVLTEAAMRSTAGSGGFALPVLFWMFLTVALPVGAWIAIARSGRRLGCAGLFAVSVVMGLVVFGTCVGTLAMPYPIQ